MPTLTYPIPLILSSLYLRGLPRACALPWSRAEAVEGVLRRNPHEDPADLLRTKGFWQEALVLTDDRLLSQAAQSQALTTADDAYPTNWRGTHAPPALWIQRPSALGIRRSESQIPDTSFLIPRSSFLVPALAIVGSRTPTPTAIQAAIHAAQSHPEIVSGGAPGIDAIAIRAAIEAGSHSTVILPCGINHADNFLAWSGIDDLIPHLTLLSAAAPNDPFSTALAMERNALIYSYANATLAIQPRFRTGGTWHGAVAALRKRHRVLLLPDDSPATKALEALGAERAGRWALGFECTGLPKA